MTILDRLNKKTALLTSYNKYKSTYYIAERFLHDNQSMLDRETYQRIQRKATVVNIFALRLLLAYKKL